MVRKKETALEKVKTRVRERKPRSILRKPKIPSISAKIIRKPNQIVKNRFKTEGQLTRDHLIALRNADHVKFENIKNNKSKITCFKDISSERNNSNIITWDFEVTSVVWTSAGIEVAPEISVRADYTAKHTCFDWEFQTIIGKLELGDDLELIWFQDGLSSDECSKVGIHVDLLKMIVYRAEFRLHYILGIFAGNSDVRMIKVE